MSRKLLAASNGGGEQADHHRRAPDDRDPGPEGLHVEGAGPSPRPARRTRRRTARRRPCVPVRDADRRCRTIRRGSRRRADRGPATTRSPPRRGPPRRSRPRRRRTAAALRTDSGAARTRRDEATGPTAVSSVPADAVEIIVGVVHADLQSDGDEQGEQRAWNRDGIAAGPAAPTRTGTTAATRVRGRAPIHQTASGPGLGGRLRDHGRCGNFAKSGCASRRTRRDLPALPRSYRRAGWHRRRAAECRRDRRHPR